MQWFGGLDVMGWAYQLLNDASMIDEGRKTTVDRRRMIDGRRWTEDANKGPGYFLPEGVYADFEEVGGKALVENAEEVEKTREG